LLPPCSSFGSPGPSGLQSRAAPILLFRSIEPLLSCTSTPPLSVFLLRLPRPLPSHVDHDPKKVVPRISYPALQHLRMHEPIFSLPVSQKRRETVALAPRCLTLGFGYPLDEMVWLAHPGRPLSAPNALGLRSSELFSSCVVEKPFQVSLSSLHFPAKPKRPCPGAPTVSSHSKSRAPFGPRVFSSSRDLLLS